MIRRRSLLEEHARRVHLDAVADAAQHGADGHPSGLAQQVPQRDLDCAAGLRSDPLVAQATTGEQPHPVGDGLDGIELFADDQRREDIGDGRRQHGCVRAAVAVTRLAVAHQTLVGVDSDEQERHRLAIGPVADRERRDGGDLHPRRWSSAGLMVRPYSGMMRP